MFLKSQLHFSDKFNKEARYVREYQKNMDQRLSMPKNLVASPLNKAKKMRCSGLNPI